MPEAEDWVEEDCFIHVGSEADIHVIGLINESCAQCLPVMLKEMDTDPDVGDSPIELHIDSGGGCPFYAFHISDVIRDMTHGTIGFGRGIVASAALPIFCSCGYRVCGRNTVFMTHSCSSSLENAGVGDIRAHHELIDRLNHMMAWCISNTSEQDLEWWLKKIDGNKDFYFYADEALEWGVVHEVR